MKLTSIAWMLSVSVALAACTQKPDNPSKVVDEFIRAMYFEYNYDVVMKLSNDEMRENIGDMIKRNGKESMSANTAKYNSFEYKIRGERIDDFRQILDGHTVDAEAIVNVYFKGVMDGSGIDGTKGFRLQHKDGN